MSGSLKAVVETLARKKNLGWTSFRDERISRVDRKFSKKEISFNDVKKELQKDFKSYEFTDADYRDIEKLLK